MLKAYRALPFLVSLLIVFGVSEALAKDLTFGLVPSADSQLRSEDQARLLATYLEKQLGFKVVLRLFKDEKVLHDWLNKYRQVDLAVLSRSYVSSQRGGEFFSLADLSPNLSADLLVARQGMPVYLVEHIQKTLEQLTSTEEGRALLGRLEGRGGKAPSGVPVAVGSSGMAAAAPVKVESRSPDVQAETPSGPSLVLGFVPSAQGPFQSETQARLFAGYLERRLGGLVSIRVFQDPAVLYDWMNRYREVDLAVVDEDYPASRAGGALNVLAELQASSMASVSPARLVLRQGVNPELDAQLVEVLKGMSADTEGRPLLEALGGVRLSLPGDGFRPSRTELPHARTSVPTPGTSLRSERTLDRVAQVPSAEADLSAMTDSDFALRTGRRPLDYSPSKFTGAMKPVATPPGSVEMPSKVPALKKPIVGEAVPKVEPLPRPIEKPEEKIPALQIPKAPAPVVVPPSVATAVEKPVPTGAAKPAPVTLPTRAPVTFGIVPDWSTLVHNEDQAKRLGAYLESKLGGDVLVRLFQGEQDLFAWLSTHRQVDLAVLRLDSLGKTADNVYHLAIFAQIGKPRTGSTDMVVVQNNLEMGLLNRVQSIMVSMSTDPEGRSLLNELGVSEILPMGGAASPDTIPIKPEAQTAPAVEATPKPVRAPSVPPLVVVPEVPAPPAQPPLPAAPTPIAEEARQGEDEVSRPAPFARVMPPVSPSAQTPAEVPKTPPAAPSAPLMGAAPKAPEGAARVPDLSKAGIAADVLEKPVVATPEKVIRPVPVVPGLPQAPPVVPTLEKPGLAVKKETPAAEVTAPVDSTPAPSPGAKPVEPGIQLASLAPPRPTPAPPGLSALDLLKEQRRAHVVYVAPFTTVMVPSVVADSVFDDFVDRLNDEGAALDTEFVILKDPSEGMDPAWLAGRSYVMGEIFGYVEDSGCCSTEIRAKSRLFLHRPGEAAQDGGFEYPVKAFFDHDRSTLEQEREKIARSLASELSSYLLKNLASK